MNNKEKKMGVSPPTASIPQHSIPQQPRPATRPVVAEGDPTPVKAGAGRTASTPLPGAATPTPRGKHAPSLPPEELGERAVNAYLEERLVSVYNSDPSHDAFVRQLQESARNAAKADVNVQKTRLRERLAAANPALSELEESELRKNVADADVLWDLANDNIPLQQVRRGIADVLIMRARADFLRQLETGRKLVNSSGPLPAGLSKALQADGSKAIKTAREAESEMGRAVLAAKIDGDDESEVKRCEEGFKKAHEVRLQVERTVAATKVYMELRAGSLAAAATKEAQLAFHDAQVRWLKEADEIRRELARGAEAEIAASDQRKRAADAEADKRWKSEFEMKAREKRLHLAELNKVAENKFVLEQERQAAEVAKQEGPRQGPTHSRKSDALNVAEFPVCMPDVAAA